MSERTLSIEGYSVPRFLYGTAWKEDETQRLTELAIEQGFRGIDTANQRRHYHEAAVGSAVAACIERGLVSRHDVFLQTKFTFQSGQDHRLPYDPGAAITTQVEQSFSSSLEHLSTPYIDSYLLHGPSTRSGLASADWAAWRAMERIQESKLVRMLGVSNVSVAQLRLLCGDARIGPHFVQNRCFSSRGWDRDVRAFCAANGILYQAFSLLTANREALTHPGLARIAQHHGRAVSQIVFRFAQQLGIIPLTGTSSAEHMRGDLEVFGFNLDAEEIQQIENLVIRSPSND